MMKVALIAALSMVVVVIAQHPRHCDAPFEMEARAFQIDPKLQFARRGHIAYDAHNERTSFFEDVINGTNQNFFHEIHLFRERRRFRIDLKAKTCTVEHSDMRFRPWHIPRDAEFVGEAYIGTNAFQHSGVLTTHWNHRNKTENTDWYGVFTDRDVGCVPIMDNFHDPKIGTVHTSFFDVVLGIGDPNQFIPPHSCQQAKPAHRLRK
jgi:hypothetical protein